MADTNLSTLRLGTAGLTPDSRVGQMPPGTNPGALTSPIYVFDIAPATTQLDNIAVAQTVSGGAWTVSGGTGTTTTSIGGVTYVDLGCDRCVAASGATVSTTVVNITVSGLDSYLQPVTATFSGPLSGLLTSCNKTMRYVRGVATTGNTTSTVSIGAGDVFGFPYRVDNFGDVRMSWANVVTTSVGFSAAVTTDPSTAFTGDVRGTYTPPSASNGSRRLTAFIYIRDPNTITGLYGVKQV